MTQAEREAILRRARVVLPGITPRPALADNPPDSEGTLSGSPVRCRYLPGPPRGTTPKFDCVLPDGEVVKVKYGRNAEIPAEVAATRLLAALAFPADRMYVIPRLRCYGCPRNPFLAAHLTHTLGADGWLAARGAGGRYADFAWAIVERKFNGDAIETADSQGWVWWELDRIDPDAGATRADVDTLRLFAVFLAHWDNKAANQRLVCQDAACAQPIAMMQDLGATFGPHKVNLAEWKTAPVWADRRTCQVSMRSFPYGGATFKDAEIAEVARRRLGDALGGMTEAQLRQLFAAARFPQFYSSTDDKQDLDAWTAAFRHRVAQILDAGPCPR